VGLIIYVFKGQQHQLQQHRLQQHQQQQHQQQRHQLRLQREMLDLFTNSVLEFF